MAGGGVEKVLGHGIDEGEVPTGFGGGGGLQFCDGEPGIREPGNVAHVVGAEGFDGMVGGDAERVVGFEAGVNDDLEGGRGGGNGGDFVPMDVELEGLLGGCGEGRGEAGG